jgi:hypothetical protein
MAWTLLLQQQCDTALPCPAALTGKVGWHWLRQRQGAVGVNDALPPLGVLALAQTRMLWVGCGGLGHTIAAISSFSSFLLSLVGPEG